MPRRPPPSPIHLHPSSVPIPPRRSPKYRLPTLPPPIPLIISASSLTIRSVIPAPIVVPTHQILGNDVYFGSASGPPPWVSSRPTPGQLEGMLREVERMIKRPEEVKLVERYWPVQRVR